ncbi:maltose O-acetyltransferase [bacterium A37T11]|nr:maltose O-acetyltransferase [bacterium A37T11]
MLQGEPYSAFGKELSAERQYAKNLLHEFNALPPDKVKEREKIIKDLLGGTGKRFFLEPPFRCDYGYNIVIGENFFSNYNCTILDCAAVTIGNDVLFAPNVSLFTAGHPIHHEPRTKQYEYAFPITIGHRVWIGGNVVINPGVTIGDNSVIGSGSVVTRDIPANVVAVGNPCRVMRDITEDDRQYYFRKLKF